MSTQFQTWRPKPRRRSKLFAQIDASPLLAVFLFLVVLYMLSFSRPRRNPVIDLAVLEHATPQPGALREDALEISINRNGALFLAGNNNTRGGRVQSKELPDRLRSMLLPGVERRVYVRADARARYGDVEGALIAIRNAGLPDVTFIVDNRQDVGRWMALGRR
jgi:biopolymer transport protein ExbD